MNSETDAGKDRKGACPLLAEKLNRNNSSVTTVVDIITNG